MPFAFPFVAPTLSCEASYALRRMMALNDLCDNAAALATFLSMMDVDVLTSAVPECAENEGLPSYPVGLALCDALWKGNVLAVAAYADFASKGDNDEYVECVVAAKAFTLRWCEDEGEVSEKTFMDLARALTLTMERRYRFYTLPAFVEFGVFAHILSALIRGRHARVAQGLLSMAADPRNDSPRYHNLVMSLRYAMNHDGTTPPPLSTILTLLEDDRVCLEIPSWDQLFYKEVEDVEAYREAIQRRLDEARANEKAKKRFEGYMHRPEMRKLMRAKL